MGARADAERFADTTSMHGLPKIIQAKTKLVKVFWILVCLGAGIMFFMEVIKLFQRYYSFPKKVSIDIIYKDIDFPDITICSMRDLDPYVINEIDRLFNEDMLLSNKSDHPFIQKYFDLLSKYNKLYLEYSDQYHEKFEEMLTKSGLSASIPFDIVKQGSVALQEYLVDCFLGAHPCNTTRDFIKYTNPNYLACYTYSAPKGVHSKLMRGKENGWAATLFSGNGMVKNANNIRRIPVLKFAHRTLSRTEGTRVIIHPPGSYPFPLTEGFDVPTGFAASFGIRVRQTKRIGQPHGNCTAHDPFGLPVYQEIACQKFCMQEHIIKMCNCSDISLPTIQDAESCQNMSGLSEGCIENATEHCLQQFLLQADRIECARKHREFVLVDHEALSECGCYPSCNEQWYDIAYSLSRWPASAIEGNEAIMNILYDIKFPDRFEGPAKKNLSSEYFSKSNRESLQKDFMRLNVFLADSSIQVIEEYPDYTTTQLLSDIGGQLGLWVGISVITVTEVLVFLASLFRYALPQRFRSQSHESVPTNAR